MGINFKKILEEDPEQLSVNRNAKAIKTLIRMAIGVLVAIVLIIVASTFQDKDKARRDDIIQDMRVIRDAVKVRGNDNRIDPTGVPLVGEELTKNPMTVTTNGVVEEYRYGYYFLSSDDLKELTDALKLPNEEYIVNYDTQDVVNVKGIKFKKLEYHTLEDVLIVAQNAVPPVRQIIRTPEDLDKIRKNPNGYFKLSANLDMSEYSVGEGFRPIDNFNGTLDGRGYAIENLTISSPSSNYIGFFSTLGSSAKITNLRFENVDIQGGEYVGVVAGNSYGTITYVKVNGGSLTGNTNYAGGLVGAHANKTISNCTVALDRISANSYAGGLVGMLYSGTVERCGANCSSIVGSKESLGGAFGLLNVSSDTYIQEVSAKTGDITGQKNIGGFIGEINTATNKKLSIENSYAIGTIAGVHQNAGGFVGYLASTKDASLQINYSYASVGILRKNESSGGFVGHTNILGSTSPQALRCYFEVIKEPGEVINAIGMVENNPLRVDFQAKESAEMLLRTTFADWKFGTIWEIKERNTTPYLIWEQ